tara:strand:+ start:332 stop:940 length:609 start_codon:yes stop_codon:yes gene_type:complete
MASIERKIISLGSNCSVSYQLKKHELRKEAYPFDYCLTPINKLLNVLENEFIDYDKIKKVKLSSNHKIIDDDITEKNSLVLSNKYNIKFAHEIETDREMKNFENSLKRRISRFIDLENPIFIRIETSNMNEEKMKEKYDKLTIYLKEYFVNYKLVLISDKKYENDKTKWIKLDKFTDDWTYDYINWYDIFYDSYSDIKSKDS